VIDNTASDAAASTGDTLALPTRPSEGVILFLSSRDHDPQTEAEQRKLSQNRELELYAMKPDGSGQTRLIAGNQGWWNLEVAVTPYVKPNQVVINGRYVFDLTTRQVVDELRLEFTLPGAPRPQRASLPVWSPRGEILFCCITPGAIYYLADIGAKLQPLTSPPAEAWGDGFPAWSPDGEWIVFMRNWYDESQDGLWLMKPDGNKAHRIIPGQYSVPRRAFWSPDGRQLAYEGPKSPGEFSFEIWVAEADGRNPRQLTSFDKRQSAWEPKWSPDGRRIVFYVGDSYSGNIFVIDAAGGEPKQLTTLGDANLAPLWLPLSSGDILDSSPAQPIPSPQPVVIAPKPTPAAPANCPNPGAQITTPVSGAVFTERYNYILGTANINRFHHWRIEYSTTPGGGWNYLLERDYPVDNDKLIMLDASTVPNGPYGLRLTVVDETGNYPPPCEVWYTNSY
jgi:Tol biopolymer transport system component